MNELLKEWIDKAEGDFATAQRELAAEDTPNYDAACFHAQQCVEKLLKAALIQHGVTAPRTHDLFQLYLMLQPESPKWQPKVADLRYLTRAAVSFRYPGESAEYEEAEEALAICRKLRETLLRLLEEKR